jgi:hypothetical protein
MLCTVYYHSFYISTNYILEYSETRKYCNISRYYRQCFCLRPLLILNYVFRAQNSPCHFSISCINIFVDKIRYEAYALYMFFVLCIEYSGGWQRLIGSVMGLPRTKLLLPLWCWVQPNKYDY